MSKIIEFFHSMFAPNVTSAQFSLNLQDFAKGLLVAVFTTPITIIGQTIQHSIELGQYTFVFDWKTILGAAFSGFCAYIYKNFVSSPAK